VSDQQFPPPRATGANRRPDQDVSFFAPSGGEFSQAPSFSKPAAFGAGPDPRFGAAAPLGRSSFAPPAPRPVTEPVLGLAQAATVLTFVVAGADLLTSLTSFGAETNLAAALATLAGVGVYVGAAVANWIVVGIWLTRARANAQRLEPRAPHRRAAAWIWLGWIVPIAWFFVPHQVVTDVWNASRGRAAHGENPKLGLWWGLWIGGLVLGSWSYRLSEADPGLAAVIGLLSSLLWVGAAVLFAGVVKTVSAAQSR